MRPWRQGWRRGSWHIYQALPKSHLLIHSIFISFALLTSLNQAQKVVRTEGNWCPECRLYCNAENLPSCQEWPGLSNLRRQRPPDWLEISRLCFRPKMPTNGEFSVYASVKKECDLPTNESFSPRSSCLEPGYAPSVDGGSPPSCVIDPFCELSSRLPKLVPTCHIRL